MTADFCICDNFCLFIYDLEFRPTQRHSNADGLSRLPVVSKDSDNISDVPKTAIINISQVHSLPVTAMQLQRATDKERPYTQ